MKTDYRDENLQLDQPFLLRALDTSRFNTKTSSSAKSSRMGAFLQSTAAFFAAILTVILAVDTKGNYYLLSEPIDIPKEDYISKKPSS